MKTNYELFVGSEPEIDMSQFKRAELDLHYADESPNQTLDIMYPDEGEGPYPLVLVFHGGAFCAGHKRSHYIKSMCLPVTQGYAVATIEYRLYTEAIWPAQLYDGKAAIRYLRAHANELNLDPDRFAVWGNSAGGTVTQLLAVTGDNPELDDLSMGEEASSAVQAALAWYCMCEVNSCEQFGFDIAEERARTGAGKGMMPGGGTEKVSMFTNLLGYDPILYPERTAKVSPITYVDENCPPMLIEHGTNDMVIDPKQSEYMYKKITEVCGEGRAILKMFEGEPHGSQKIKDHKNINECIDFLDQYFFDGNNLYRKPLVDLKILGEE